MYIISLTALVIRVSAYSIFFIVAVSTFYLYIVGGSFSELLYGKYGLERLSFAIYNFSIWVFFISAILLPYSIKKCYDNWYDKCGRCKFIYSCKNPILKYVLPFVFYEYVYVQTINYTPYSNDDPLPRDWFFFSMFAIAYSWVILKIIEMIG